jgi:PAS domain S-box-containing protein
MPLTRAEKQSGFARYLLPFLAVGAAAALRWCFDPHLVWKVPFALFILAILVSARAGGKYAGFLATGLSVAVGFATVGTGTAAVTNLALFGGAGFGISLICGQLRDLLEQTVRERERLRLISDTVPQFLWTSDADGRCDFLNARWYEYSGANPADGVDWTAFVHPEDIAALDEYRAGRAAHSGEGSCEIRIRRYDGAYRWFDLNMAPSRDSSGAVRKWFGALTDTDASRRERIRFAQLLRSAPGVISQFELRADGSTRMPFASAGLKDIYGLEPADVKEDASPIFERIAEQDRDRVRESVARSAQTLELE